MVKWTKELVTGIGTIDNQHKKILKHINKICKLFELRKSCYEIIIEVEQLIELADIHNRTEQKYMEQYNFPEYNSHKNDHKIFIENLNIIKSKVNNSTDCLKALLENQLNSWFDNHLINYDKRLDEYINMKILISE